MRRLLLMAAVVAFSLVPLTVFAQRGGGMHGGGFAGHAGFSSHSGMRAGGFGGGMRGGSPGMMSGARFSSHHSGTWHGGSGSWHGGSGSWHGGSHHRHSGPNLIIGSRFRFRYPYYAYAPFGYYSPFWWDWYSSSYDRSDNDDNYVAQRQTQQQFDQLYQQIQDLRDERDEREYGRAQSQPAPVPPAPTRSEATIQPDMSVVLVYLDKRIEEIKNYAVANEKVVVFDNNRIRKIPLADIDLAATMKLNDERGVNFQIPNPAGTE
jgi:hypothetical protein